MFNWRSIRNSRSSDYMVKGSELSVAVPPGHHSRYAIYEVRCFRPVEPAPIIGPREYSDVRYHIRDAGAVSDAQVRDGVRPPVVFRADTLDECITWLASR